MEYNVYCDESCHLLNDESNSMGIGCIWCPTEKVKSISKRLKEIKERNNHEKGYELKWTKISKVTESLYFDIINYFFDDDDLHFRILVLKDKSVLDHSRFNQTHDDFYYKMFFNMLKTILSPTDKYNIYIDIKDKYSYEKEQHLREVCSNEFYDFSMSIIKKIQPIRSEESQLLQLADVLIGACVYNLREFPVEHKKSQSKINIINRIKYCSGYSLQRNTLMKESKFNYIIWRSNYEL